MLEAKSVGLPAIPRRIAYYTGTLGVCVLLAFLLIIVFREIFAPFFLKMGLKGGASSTVLRLIPGLVSLRLEHYVYLPAVLLASVYFSLRHMLAGTDRILHLGREITKDFFRAWILAFLFMPAVYVYLVSPLLGSQFKMLFASYPDPTHPGLLLGWYRESLKRILVITGFPVLVSALSTYMLLAYRHKNELSYPRLIPGADPTIRSLAMRHMLDGRYGDAMFSVYRYLDEEVRKVVEGLGITPRSGLTQNWEILFANKGPLKPRDPKWRLGGIRSLGIGASILFRNPMAHSTPTFTLQEAVVGIYVADFLLGILRGAIRKRERGEKALEELYGRRRKGRER